MMILVVVIVAAMAASILPKLGERRASFEWWPVAVVVLGFIFWPQLAPIVRPLFYLFMGR